MCEVVHTCWAQPPIGVRLARRASGSIKRESNLSEYRQNNRTRCPKASNRYSLIVFQNRHISGALAELIRSTRAPTKDRLIGKIMGGNPAFRGTRVPSTCSPSCALARARRLIGKIMGELCPQAVGEFSSREIAYRPRRYFSGLR